MAQAASSEKTEQPTTKRLRDAQQKGQVARSEELTSAIITLAALAVFWLTGGYVGEILQNSVKDQISFAASFKGDFKPETAMNALGGGLKIFALALAPFFAALVLAAAIANRLQVGSIFSAETVKPNFKKLSPTENLKQNFFGARVYLGLGKIFFKIIVAAVIIGWILGNAASDLLRLTNQPIELAIGFAFRLALDIFFKIGLAFLVLGVGDYFLQQYLHRRALMMTKQEIKEENRETEGDPLTKSRRRALHREIISQDLTVAVKQAAVIIADNAAKIAVALGYDRERMDAPAIAAKGADAAAAKILEIAAQENVPVRRNEKLARAFFELKVGDEISKESYEAVAVVLREVYEAQKTKS
jgi:flagellar biosynthesis protein FlhB